ncbi:MAG: HD domain-containing protein [Paludibacterium sp.]|uniref:HD domain-containing phosphohydrolase n=1 Tax=Paludibacterium sp. TaxID=1917523 RepID=UPI0025D6A29F|nr:HD domain-containing phosphohydrolase [Paludibacterium sp.]MBV8046131.1 HD domain-containing protein [Paludibacterium sp.]MBV8648803.1 HD domain-containing protein [Paludibacterium sp.]
MTDEQISTLIEDEDSFHDFHDALNDYAPHIEALVALLRQQPGDTGAVADLFRTFHNIKGDASLCRLSFLVPFIHAAETLLARVRAGEVPFTPRLADVLLLSTDRLQQTVEALAANEPTGGLHLKELTASLEALKSLPPPQLERACGQLIDALTGVDETRGEAPDLAALTADRTGDLAFFKQLALQLERRSSLFTGRTERNLTLALLTNQLAGSPVDADQLRAAVYVHDLGMMLLPETLWVGSRVMNDAERALMREHVGWASGILQRIPGWDLAARIVLHHHEKPDGSGYPQGLLADEIEPGAKIMALVDAFESVMVKQGARGQPRSTLRAAAEVNAADHQFDKYWVNCFNRAVQHLLDERT